MKVILIISALFFSINSFATTGENGCVSLAEGLAESAFDLVYSDQDKSVLTKTITPVAPNNHDEYTWQIEYTAGVDDNIEWGVAYKVIVGVNGAMDRCSLVSMTESLIAE